MSTLFKDISEHVKKTRNLELTNDLLDLQQKMLELFTENQDLKQQLADMQSEQDLAHKVVFQGGAYYNKETLEGPFCTSCWESEKKLIHLTTSTLRVHGVQSMCPNCKSHFDVPHNRSLE
ncbi:hypothetical protein [Lacticaseibacillus hulanensis]|uniref:hypothetical protein n=1 Tax=Lacticaseibacillus hulanensis TaxID=2493111 RepID=UPI000FDBFC6B|nr:hypothetical protein [Lacticaseibacillus hulanensis]